MTHGTGKNEMRQRPTGMRLRRTFRVLTLCASLNLLCQGCASTRMSANPPHPSPGTTHPATVRVTRDGLWANGGVPLYVIANDCIVGAIGPSGVLEWQQDPGPIKLEVSGTGPVSKVRDDLKPDSVTKYICGLEMGMSTVYPYVRRTEADAK